jgi:hypothetical protein
MFLIATQAVVKQYYEKEATTRDMVRANCVVTEVFRILQAYAQKSGTIVS